MDIGFIGVGNMGAGMANNLLKAGYTLTLNDIRRDAAGPLLEKAPDGLRRRSKLPCRARLPSPLCLALLKWRRWRWVRRGFWRA